MNYSVVSGGAALIGGSLIAATGLFTPAVGALVFGNNRVMIINIIQRDKNIFTLGTGSALFAGNMVAQEACLGTYTMYIIYRLRIYHKFPSLNFVIAGPIYCRTAQGQCCTLVNFRGNVLCPQSC